MFGPLLGRIFESSAPKCAQYQGYRLNSALAAFRLSRHSTSRSPNLTIPSNYFSIACCTSRYQNSTFSSVAICVRNSCSKFAIGAFCRFCLLRFWAAFMISMCSELSLSQTNGPGARVRRGNRSCSSKEISYNFGPLVAVQELNLPFRFLFNESGGELFSR